MRGRRITSNRVAACASALLAASAILAALAAAAQADRREPGSRSPMLTTARRRTSASREVRTARSTCSGQDRTERRTRRSSTRRSRPPARSEHRSRSSRAGRGAAPAAASAPDGSIHVLVSGQKVASNTDLFAGLNEAVGPGSWTLGSKAFGRFQLTVASAAQITTAALRSGQLVSAWRSANTLLFQSGVDPGTQPTDITPTGLADDPVIAVDQGSGEAFVAYEHVASGQAFVRRVLPSVGAPQPLSPGRLAGPQLAARAGGGVYTAYSDGALVRIARLGGQPKPVPVPSRAPASRRPGSLPDRTGGSGSSTATPSKRT